MDSLRPRTPGGWLTHRQGNVALIFALLLPLLLVTGMGAVELNQVLSDQRATQNVADAAALMGASQMGVTPSGADQRAQAFAMAQLTPIERYASVKVAATEGQDSTMAVAIDTQRASFFGSLFPPGGFHTHVSSTAKGMNTVPLCVLSLATSSTPANMVHVTGNSQLQAGSCMVHSNTALTADPLASISAQANEATTTAFGPITQIASIGAPSIPDPFTGVNTGTPSCAGAQNVSYGNGPQTMSGALYNNVNISGDSTVTVSSGPHYFCGNLVISGNGTLTGQNTTLIFEGNAQLQPSGSAQVSLEGAQSGPLAGFVLVADRGVTSPFPLQSDFFTKLTGTVYAPNAPLTISGSKAAGSTTPWTVVVAQSVSLNGGAQLLINSNYLSSNVPVPTGVGNNRQNVQLLQ